jgi:hypothetical protein
MELDKTQVDTLEEVRINLENALFMIAKIKGIENNTGRIH